MTKCKEDIKANFEKKFGVTLESCEECVQMSDESPEKFKAECKTISERFLDNIVKGECKEAEKFFFNDQDLCEKYTKDGITCGIIMKAKGISGMGVLICKPIVRYKMAADFFEGEQKTYQDKINDIINDLGYMKAIVCEDNKCGEKYEYVYQTLKKFKDSYEEDSERLKSIIKEHEEIESIIDVPTELMKSIYKEMQSKIESCEADSNHTDDWYQKYLTLRYPDGLYIEEVLRAFYPDLSQEMINKIVNEEYHVKQFGITINNYDNGKNCTLTGRGNINEINNEPIDCFPIPPDSEFTESYNLKSDAIHCGKHIFDRDTYITISKALGHDETIDQIEPLVTVSQSQPLIIANVYNGKLIKKDGTVTKTTLNACKEFYDNDGRITDCTGKGEECYTCKESMWDYQGPEIPVYMHGYSPEML